MVGITSAVQVVKLSGTFSLDEPRQGALAVTLIVGSTFHACMSFGGTVRNDLPGRFEAINAPAPIGCPGLS